jgi:hypothetical protein
MSVNIQVSVGELLDKYSILEIKLSKITDYKKIKYIEYEISRLSPYSDKYLSNIGNVYYEYRILKYINKLIWDFNEEASNSEKFNGKDIMDLNNARFRVKRWINEKCMSGINEVKSYKETCLYVKLDEQVQTDVNSIYVFCKWKLIFFDKIFIVLEEINNELNILNNLKNKIEGNDDIRIVSNVPKGTKILKICYDEVPGEFFDILS